MIYDFFHIILIIILFEVLLFDVFRIEWKKGVYNLSFNLTWIVLALISAFRYGVGSDTVNYMTAYDLMPTLSELEIEDFVRFRFSPLYIIINSALKSFTSNFLLLQIFQCLIFFSGLYYVLKLYDIRKIYIILFFYLFLYFMDGITAMRESFAMGLCFFSLRYYEEKKWLKFYLLVVIAFLFHSGAMIFFILPFIYYLSLKGRKSIGYIAVGSIALLVVITIFSEILQEFLSFGDGSLGRYVNGDDGPASFSVANIFRNFIIVYIIIRNLFTEDYNVRVDIMLIAIVYSVIDIVAGKIPMAMRLASYFQFAMFYAVAVLLPKFKDKSIWVRISIILVFFYQPVMRYLVLWEGYGYDPYCSAFSEDKSYYKKIYDNADASDYVLY